MVLGERAREGLSARGSRPSSLLLDCLNKGVLPVVPSRGSVGASGDLAPLAHSRFPWWARDRALRRRASSGADALARAGLEPVRLQAKEGPRPSTELSSMGAVGSLGLVRARRIAKTLISRARSPSRRLQGLRVSFMPEIQALRPLAGQAAAAANVVRLLEGSAIIERIMVRQGAGRLPLRCAPQVHGASRDLSLRRAHGFGRGQRSHGQPPRPRRQGRAGFERELPRPAGRPRARLHGPVAEFASISERASSGSSTRRCPTGCPRSSRTTAGSTQGS